MDSIWDVFLSEEEHEYLEKKKNQRPVTLAMMDGEFEFKNLTQQQSQNSISNRKRHSAVFTKFSNRKWNKNSYLYLQYTFWEFKKLLITSKNLK